MNKKGSRRQRFFVWLFMWTAFLSQYIGVPPGKAMGFSIHTWKFLTWLECFWFFHKYNQSIKYTWVKEDEYGYLTDRCRGDIFKYCIRCKKHVDVEKDKEFYTFEDQQAVIIRRY